MPSFATGARICQAQLEDLEGLALAAEKLGIKSQVPQAPPHEKTLQSGVGSPKYKHPSVSYGSRH